MAVADFNLDGRADIAVGNSDATITLFFGTSSGHLAYGGNPLTFGTSPTYLVVADFNHDGVPDLIATEVVPQNPTGYYNLTILLAGTGDGTFEQQEVLPAIYPVSAVAADFNGDGYDDLAVAELLNNTVLVFLNSEIGFLSSSPISIPAGSSPQSIAAGDFNGDGKLDLAVADSDSNSVAILLGDGAGNFAASPAGPIPAGNTPFFVAVGDFNGDGRADMSVVDFLGGNVTILLGSPGTANQATAATAGH